MEITRTANDRYEPAYQETWPPLTQLEWLAGVVQLDTGLSIAVMEHTAGFAVAVGAEPGHGSMQLEEAWKYLVGVRTGAAEAAR